MTGFRETPPQPAEAGGATDDITLDVVRQMMEAQAKAAPEPEPEIEVEPAVVVQAAPAPLRAETCNERLQGPQALSQDREEGQYDDLAPRASLIRRLAQRVVGRVMARLPQLPPFDELRARVLAFRPSRKQILWTTLIVVVLWRPWLIPGIVFVLFWIGLIVHLTLGPDRVAELGRPLMRRLAKRYPERAAALQQRAQAGADVLERWIERLPERWREGVYLPDLGRSDKAGIPDEMLVDPFERLVAERRDARIDAAINRVRP